MKPCAGIPKKKFCWYEHTTFHNSFLVSLFLGCINWIDIKWMLNETLHNNSFILSDSRSEGDLLVWGRDTNNWMVKYSDLLAAVRRRTELF